MTKRRWWMLSIAPLTSATISRAMQQQQTMRPASTPIRRRRLIWHRYRDLRLHDNPLYSDTTSIIQKKDDNGNDDNHCNSNTKPIECLPFFIFDDRDFAPRPSTCRPHHWQAVHFGPHASRILLESVQVLQASLREQGGGDLCIRRGSTVPVILQLLQETQATELVWNEEPGVYEQERSRKVLDAVTGQFPKVEIYTFCDSTLYHPDDLPRGTQEWERYAHPQRQNKMSKKKNRNNQKQNKASGKSNAINMQPLSSSNYSNRHLVDLSPSRWEGIPPVMGDFRRAARDKAPVRPCLNTPPTNCILFDRRIEGDHHNHHPIPTLEDLLQPLLALSAEDQPILGISHVFIRQVCHHAIRQQNDNRDSNHNETTVARGGETPALHHLKDFCQYHAASAKRNLACVDNHQSARISHSLAFGCLSPRKVIEEAELQNQTGNGHNGNGGSGGDRGDGDDCNWLISHMTMRDFFLYSCLANGRNFYHRDGIPVNQKAAESIVWKDWNLEEAALLPQQWNDWATGRTGLPMVDAAMREMVQTGYCSNRVRQNAASVLTKDLGIDWRAGAEWFQFLLCDHCVGANWGNWLYFSGKGSDPKNRHFRTVSQALKYDEDGTYVKKWLPELVTFMGSCQEKEEVFLRPWDFATEKNPWKDPIVPSESQYTWHDLEQLKNEGQLLTKNKA